MKNAVPQWKPLVALAFALFFIHSAALAVDETVNGSDIPVSRDLIQGGSNDSLFVPSLDIFADENFANFGGGTDTIFITGNSGSFSAAEIRPEGDFRNFERIGLSEDEETGDIWTVGENDNLLEYIDARRGTDTVAFGDGNHSAANIGSGGLYRNFERANLSNSDNVWAVTGNDRNLESIDALGNTANGADILENQITDAERDGVFNSSDSSFSNSDLNSGEFAKYLNFEGVAVGLTNGADVWVVSEDDFNGSKDWRWVNAREGTDTLENPINDEEGDGIFNSSDSSFSISDLGSGAFANYANFEQVAVRTTEGADVWTVSEDDFNAAKGWQWINAAEGTDTIVLGDGDHSAANIGSDGFYRNFEQANLSGGNNIWRAGENDRGLEIIDALNGSDTVAFGDGNHSAAEIHSGGRYRNFEQANLSDGNNIWMAGENDFGLEFIDALDGTDTVAFGDGNHSAANIGSGGLYRNFERANLSDSDNIWTVGGNDLGLEFIDALNGSDTVAFGDGNHSAAEIHSGGRYRNFERVELSANDNVWRVGENDRGLQSINALGGTDTLEDSVTDAGGDGFFNSSDSSFSESDLGNGAYANYSNFEQVSIGLTDGDDVWAVSEDDFNGAKEWQWINARGGTDTLEDSITDAEGDGLFNSSDSSFSESDLGNGAFVNYRNFERVAVGTTNNDDVWVVSENDFNAARRWRWINARGGTDTIVLGDGNHSAAEIHSAGRYRNFEQANLSDNNNIWTVTDNDEGLDFINALGGTDTLEFGRNGQRSAENIGPGLRYRNFEGVMLSSGDDAWSITDNDRNLESIDALGNTANGADVLENQITDAERDGVFNSSDSSFSNSDLNSGAFAKYLNFEGVAVGLTNGADVWVVSEDDFNGSKDWRWINARGGNGSIDTIVLGDGNHSAANISSNGLYRNFEQANLSDNDNSWTVTDNDGNLVIDALNGADTVVFGDGNHSAAEIHSEGIYRNFERVELSANDNVWTVGNNDRPLEYIDALGNTANGADTIVFGDGNHSAANISSNGLYRNFERVELSANDNIWTVSGNDRSLEYIDALGNTANGADTIVFGDGNHSAANINSSGLYRNFERVELSANDNIWTVTENDGLLQYIDALNGADTIAFGNGHHSAENIGSDLLYRNFERVTLSDTDDSWSITDNDGNLSIDALAGTDILENQITDAERDGVFNSSDSSFSNSDLGADPFANYSGFEGVAVGLTNGADVWVVSEDDFNGAKDWRWINARSGTDTVALGDGNHSAANISSNGLYRNFEQANLSNNDNSWTVTDNDDGLDFVNALGGADTVVFGDGNHSAANISLNGLYRNFERVELSENENTWTVGDNDGGLEFIDALGGADTVQANVAEGSGRVFNGDDFGANASYRSFESLRKTGSGTLYIAKRLNLGNAGGVNIEAGTLSFDFASEDAANSGKIVSERIVASMNASMNAISVNGLDIVALSEIEGGSLAVFEGNTAGIREGIFVEPGLFADLSKCPEGICLAVDSADGARAEINDISANYTSPANPRELLRAAHSSLELQRADSAKSDIFGRLNNPQTAEETVRGLIPSEHGGISHEIIGVQRTFFESIEERIVEAVKYMPWDDASKPGKYRVFAEGFEKTSSGDRYKIGSRGLMTGIHRLIFDEKVGVGFAASASALETRTQRVSESAEGFQGALYGKFDSGRLFSSAIASFGAYEYESSRQSAFGGIGGKTDVKVYGTKVAAGLEILKSLPVRVKPELSLMLARASTDPYSETGGFDIALKGSSKTSSEAGARVSIAFNSLKTVLQTVVQPEIEAGVYYDFSNGNDDLQATLSGVDYRIYRPQINDELRYVLAGKLVLSDNRHLALKIGYRVDFLKDTRSYSGTGQFHIRF